jgi:eukaryotic-like serine/threonine-protein kinase
MRRYTDGSGFSVAVPRGWQAEHRGQRVYLRDPSSPTYLLVDQTTHPAADPVADWRAQERVVSRRLPGYRLVRMDPVTVGSWRGADWEFTHGRGTHVLNRNLVTGPDRAYALYWSAPDRGWAANMDRFRQMMATFRPSE